MTSVPLFSLVNIASGLGIAVIWIGLFSLLPEPKRRKLSAIMIAGAGAAYLSGGLGGWEFLACTAFLALAYRGLADYRFIGIGWFLHVFWDLAHHVIGHPIVPFIPASSAGCAICDLALSTWYFSGAKPFFGVSQSPAPRVHA